MGTLYSFLVAAISNYHKLIGLKQQSCVLSQLWSPEVQNQALSRAPLTLGMIQFLVSSSFGWLQAFLDL